MSQVSVIAGKLSFPLVCVFAGLHQLAGGGLLTFNSINQRLHFVLLVGFGGASNAFCSKLAKTCLQQLHHSRAGSPSELLCKLSGSAHMQGVSPAGTDL